MDYLIESGNYEEYMQKLVDAFNPATVEGLMCRNTISVSWDGYLYDCDFNQMLDLKVASPKTTHIKLWWRDCRIIFLSVFFDRLNNWLQAKNHKS